MVWTDGTLNVNCDLAFFAKLALTVGHTCWRNYKQWLDEVFVISRIMKVEVAFISRRQRLRLIALTKISIILDITKSESNKKVFIIHWTEKIIFKVMFLLLHLTASSTKQVTLTWSPLEIMHCGHTWPYYPWPWVSLTWLLYNLQLWRYERWFWKFTVRFWPIRKEITSSMYNDLLCQ